MLPLGGGAYQPFTKPPDIYQHFFVVARFGIEIQLYFAQNNNIINL